MTRREKLAEALLRPINPAAVVFLGIYTVLWGFWVANPFWDVFDQAPLYQKLTWAPETFWGCLAMTCGAFIWYGAVKRGYKSLVRGASIAFFHWLMIGVFYFWGDWQNTGGITALTFAAYAAFVYLNIRVNFKNDKNTTHVLTE